jgi:hypothetical protein
MLKTVSTQLALASDTLPEVLAKGNTTGGTDLAVSSGDDITFADNSKAIFGAGSDISIYSDGSTGQVTGNVNVTGAATLSGSLGVGATPAAANKVQVAVATNTVSTGSPVDSSFFNIQGGTTTVGDGVSLQISNLSGAKETAWRISAVTASGNNGDLVFNGYAGGADYPERLRILPTGGITFNGDTAQANALDDYEEGVWTPGYTSWLANPTVATTAKYTKIGRLVNVSVYLTGGTTQAGAQITGLPFTCGTESSMISTNGSNSSLVFYGTVLGGSTVIGSLSAETLTGTYYAVTATYMV